MNNQTIFIKTVSELVDYHAESDYENNADRCESLVFSILNFIDGTLNNSPKIELKINGESFNNDCDLHELFIKERNN